MNITKEQIEKLREALELGQRACIDIVYSHEVGPINDALSILSTLSHGSEQGGEAEPVACQHDYRTANMSGDRRAHCLKCGDVEPIHADPSAAKTMLAVARGELESPATIDLPSVKPGEPEPVAWLLAGGTDIYLATDYTPDSEHIREWTPLYTKPSPPCVPDGSFTCPHCQGMPTTPACWMCKGTGRISDPKPKLSTAQELNAAPSPAVPDVADDWKPISEAKKQYGERLLLVDMRQGALSHIYEGSWSDGYWWVTGRGTMNPTHWRHSPKLPKK